MFGQNLITDSDINGDGINDLLVYAEGPQWEQWGNVYVFLGGSQFSTTPALHIRGSNINEHLGINMQAGDINGDGFDDIVLSSMKRIDPQSDLGYIYELKVYAGGATLSDVPVFEAMLADTGWDNEIGNLIAKGDLNGDGYEDIVMQYYDLTGTSLKIIYGQSNWQSLSIQDFFFPVIWSGNRLQFYCNLNNDPFSDLCFYYLRTPESTTDIGCCVIYKQTSTELDLNFDYINAGNHTFSGYGFGYQLGDMNQDGFNELFIRSGEYSIEEYANYATILTEQHVDVQDDVLPLPNIKLDCYPNPFRDAFTISLNSNAKGFRIDNVKIYDLRGRLVYETSVFGSSSFRWDGKDKTGRLTSSGIYFVRATDKDKNTLTSKVVRVN
jgi:hypothetical protein